MKKLFVVGAAVMLLVLSLTGCGSDSLTLNVYNWGEYISDGSEGTFDTIREFENWYEETYGQKITVNYSTFASNEDMYSKISSGAVSYDVVIPSDYMIARMAQEDLLLPLNFDNIPNYKYIDDTFKGLYYDEENKYTVPYAYGIVGVIYDADVVDAEAADTESVGECGSVCEVKKDSFSILTGKGWLRINEVQLEGKKRMDVSAFLLGYPIEKGMIFPN